MTFKYQEHINKQLAQGLKMPELHTPNGMDAYRNVFSDNNSNNHKPVCIQNPSRRLPDNEKFSGYALSCFNSKEKAERRYSSLCKSFKRTPEIYYLTVGNHPQKANKTEQASSLAQFFCGNT